MKRVMRAGVRVMARKEAPSMAKVFAKARGRKSLPLLALEGKDGQESDGYDDEGKEKGWTNLFRRFNDYFSSEFGVRSSE